MVSGVNHMKKASLCLNISSRNDTCPNDVDTIHFCTQLTFNFNFFSYVTTKQFF